MRYALAPVVLVLSACSGAQVAAVPSDYDGDGVPDEEDGCKFIHGRGDPSGCIDVWASEGEACEDDTDCRSGLVCVEDCGRVSVRGLGDVMAQPESCPKVCRPAGIVSRRLDADAPDEPADLTPALRPTAP